MSRDVNNKYWDEELETLPRKELEKRQLADYKIAIMETNPKQTYNGKKNDVLINKKSIILFLINKVLFKISHIKHFNLYLFSGIKMK